MAEYPQLNGRYPAGDFVCPDGVNFVDFSVLGLAWLSGDGDGNWNPACDISLPYDNSIDVREVIVYGSGSELFRFVF